MIITMIIKNMQNKIHATQFFSPPDDGFTAPQKEFELLDEKGFKTPGNCEEPIASCPPASPHS